jgi:hypothetical protein
MSGGMSGILRWSYRSRCGAFRGTSMSPSSQTEIRLRSVAMLARPTSRCAWRRSPTPDADICQSSAGFRWCARRTAQAAVASLRWIRTNRWAHCHTRSVGSASRRFCSMLHRVARVTRSTGSPTVFSVSSTAHIRAGRYGRSLGSAGDSRSPQAQSLSRHSRHLLRTSGMPISLSSAPNTRRGTSPRGIGTARCKREVWRDASCAPRLRPWSTSISSLSKALGQSSSRSSSRTRARTESRSKTYGL